MEPFRNRFFSGEPLTKMVIRMDWISTSVLSFTDGELDSTMGTTRLIDCTRFTDWILPWLVLSIAVLGTFASAHRFKVGEAQPHSFHAPH